MSFFRSAALRRVIYAVAIALALVRFAPRVHSEPLRRPATGEDAATWRISSSEPTLISARTTLYAPGIDEQMSAGC